MKNLAQPVVNKVAKPGKGKVEPQDGILVLPQGNRPQTIYVTAVSQSTGPIAAFASQDSGPFFTEGFSWAFDDHPLFVTFVFLAGVAGVKCKNLHHSACFDGKQHMCIPANKAEYDFDVVFSSGDLHDPKIIVTPITNPS